MSNERANVKGQPQHSSNDQGQQQRHPIVHNSATSKGKTTKTAGGKVSTAKSLQITDGKTSAKMSPQNTSCKPIPAKSLQSTDSKVSTTKLLRSTFDKPSTTKLLSSANSKASSTKLLQSSKGKVSTTKLSSGANIKISTIKLHQSVDSKGSTTKLLPSTNGKISTTKLQQSTDGKVSTTKLVRGDSQKRLAKPGQKNTSRPLTARRGQREKKSTQSKVAENSPHNTSAEDTAEDMSSDEKMVHRDRNKKRSHIVQRSRQSAMPLCSFDRSFTILKDKIKRKYSPTLLPSEKLMQSDCALMDSAYDSLIHDASSEGVSCSLGNEQYCMKELTPWQLCMSPLAHQAPCLRSEPPVVSKCASNSTQVKRKTSDPSHNDKTVVVSKKWLNSLVFNGKWWVRKPQLYFPNKGVEHVAPQKSLTNEDFAEPYRGNLADLDQGQSSVSAHDQYQQPAAGSFPRSHSRLLRATNSLSPSLLFSRVVEISKQHPSTEEAQQPEDTISQYVSDNHSSVLSLCNASLNMLSKLKQEHIPHHTDKKGNTPTPVLDSETAPQLLDSSVQDDSANGSANISKTEASQSQASVMPLSCVEQSHHSVMSVLLRDNCVSDIHELCKHQSEHDTCCSTHNCSDDSEKEKQSCSWNIACSRNTSEDTMNQYAAIPMPAETAVIPEISTQSVYTIAASELSNNNCPTVVQKEDCTGLSGSLESVKMEDASVTPEKPLIAKTAQNGRPECEVLNTSRKKTRGKQPRAVERKKKDGNKVKRTLSEIFRALREKGCLVNNCPKCSQTVVSEQKALTTKQVQRSPKPRDTAKGYRLSSLDMTSRQSGRNWDSLKARADRVWSQDANCSKARAAGLKKVEPPSKGKSLVPLDVDSKDLCSDKTLYGETYQQKIKRDISLYLQIRKAIDSRCSALQRVQEGSAHELKYRPESGRSITDLCESMGRFHEVCIVSSTLVCTKKEIKEREHTDKFRNINSNEHGQKATWGESAESKRVGDAETEDSGVTDSASTTTTDPPTSASRTLPAAPPNTPAPKSKCKKRQRTRHLRRECKRLEEPLPIAKIELHENAALLPKSGMSGLKIRTMMTQQKTRQIKMLPACFFPSRDSFSGKGEEASRIAANAGSQPKSSNMAKEGLRQKGYYSSSFMPLRSARSDVNSLNKAPSDFVRPIHLFTVASDRDNRGKDAVCTSSSSEKLTNTASFSTRQGQGASGRTGRWALDPHVNNMVMSGLLQTRHRVGCRKSECCEQPRNGFDYSGNCSLMFPGFPCGRWWSVKRCWNPKQAICLDYKQLTSTVLDS